MARLTPAKKIAAIRNHGVVPAECWPISRCSGVATRTSRSFLRSVARERHFSRTAASVGPYVKRRRLASFAVGCEGDTDGATCSLRQTGSASVGLGKGGRVKS